MKFYFPSLATGLTALNFALMQSAAAIFPENEANTC
jgi:hypothetical protein